MHYLIKLSLPSGYLLSQLMKVLYKTLSGITIHQYVSSVANFSRWHYKESIILYHITMFKRSFTFFKVFLYGRWQCPVRQFSNFCSSCARSEFLLLNVIFYIPSKNIILISCMISTELELSIGYMSKPKIYILDFNRIRIKNEQKIKPCNNKSIYVDEIL